MKGKIKNLVFILILGSVCVGLLLGIRGYTTPIIKHQQEIKLKETVLVAAGIDFNEENLGQVFQSDIRKITRDGLIYYLSPDDRYIFEFKGRGLWGMIEGVITLDQDLETIESLRIVSQEETPGLGGRIGEEGFLSQFKGKKVLPALILALRKKATEENEIDAITGATITSQALIDIVNESVEDFRRKTR